MHVVPLSASRTDSPSTDALDHQIVRRIQKNNCFDRSVLPFEEFVQCFGLRRRSRQTIQQESLIEQLRRQPMLEQTDNIRIRNQLPAIHISPDFISEQGPHFHFLPEPLSS